METLGRARMWEAPEAWMLAKADEGHVGMRGSEISERT